MLAVLAFTLGVSLTILITNPHRRQNRYFLLFTAPLAAWVSLVVGIIHAEEADWADTLIRAASVVGLLIGLAYHLLCIVIAEPEIPFRGLLRRARWTLAGVLVLCAMVYSPWFLSKVTVPEIRLGPEDVPRAVYGPGIFPFVAFFPLCFGLIIHTYVRRAATLRGVQREEIQFTILGATLAIPVALMIHIAALLMGGTQQQYGPLCIVPMIGMIAYGIATRRILGAADVLRRSMAYLLMAGALGIEYYAVWRITHWFFAMFRATPDFWPSLLAALALVFSMTPAQGWMRRFLRPLLVNTRGMDVPSLLQEAALILRNITTLNDLLNRIARLIQQATGAASVAIYVKQENRFERAFSFRGQGPGLLAQDDPVLSVLRQRHEPLSVDTLDRQRPSPLLHAAGEALLARQNRLALGIYLKGVLHGVAEVGPRPDGRIYDHAEQNTLQLICDQMASAVENARLYTEIQEGKIYLDNLLEHMVSGIIAANAEGILTVFNREAQRLTGLRTEEVVGRPAAVLPAPLAGLLETTLRERSGVRDRDEHLVTAAGGRVEFRAGTSLFSGPDGRVLGALLVFNDLSAIRRLEEQVRRTDRLSSIGTLAAGMAHEIKNPLVTIKTFTQLLPERYNDPDFRGTFTELVGEEINRIDGLVNHLLNFTRPQHPNLLPVSLHQILDRSLRLIQQQLRQHHIELIRDWQAVQDVIRGDVAQLNQALLNFYLNAIEATPAGGRLEVRTAPAFLPSVQRDAQGALQPRPAIQLVIADTGSGIPPENVSHIFDPFFTTKSNGTGLGLSVAHGILVDHGAVVEVSSVVGQGTLFSMTFPLIDEEGAA